MGYAPNNCELFGANAEQEAGPGRTTYFTCLALSQRPGKFPLGTCLAERIPREQKALGPRAFSGALKRHLLNCPTD